MTIIYQLMTISNSSWTIRNFAENSKQIVKSHCESAVGN